MINSNSVRLGVWLSVHNSGRPSAAIFGCSGLVLGAEEAKLFEQYRPVGFILFQRNIESPAQVRALVNQLRSILSRDDAPILIDQEGGRVSRLGPPNWPKILPAAVFGNLALKNIDAACEAVHAHAQLVAIELKSLGISVNCAPVLDLRIDRSHKVIGDRAFSSDPSIVTALGRAYCNGMLMKGILPVIKHIPGHGRGRVDSHKQLPRVEVLRSALETTDFLPFRMLSDMPLAMTAHVAYSDIDGVVPATISASLIEGIIRSHMGFEGLLLSDDISMSALDTNFRDIGDRSKAALNAGCDIVLHCNANLAEMRSVAEACGVMTDGSYKRWFVASEAANKVQSSVLLSVNDLIKRRDTLLKKS